MDSELWEQSAKIGTHYVISYYHDQRQ
jgi:hypothetical protein